VALDLLNGTPTFSAIPHLTPQTWLLLAYLVVVCTLVGYSLWYLVIRETEVNVTGLTVFAQPVAGLMLSVIWVGEALHWGQFWGSLAIIAGLVIALRPDRAGVPQPVSAKLVPVSSETGQSTEVFR